MLHYFWDCDLKVVIVGDLCEVQYGPNHGRKGTFDFNADNSPILRLWVGYSIEILSPQAIKRIEWPHFDLQADPSSRPTFREL